MYLKARCLTSKIDELRFKYRVKCVRQGTKRSRADGLGRISNLFSCLQRRGRSSPEFSFLFVSCFNLFKGLARSSLSGLEVLLLSTTHSPSTFPRLTALPCAVATVE